MVTSSKKLLAKGLIGDFITFRTQDRSRTHARSSFNVDVRIYKVGKYEDKKQAEIKKDNFKKQFNIA
jgi:hypothetical protein